MNMSNNILITGAANGLGAAFLEALKLQDQVNHIFALDRVHIEDSSSNVKSYKVDVSSQDSINNFMADFGDQSINLVIHSAGIRGLVPATEAESPGNVAECEKLQVMDLSTLMRAFQINAAGTFMLLRALIPNLRRAGSGSKVVVMSSRMGSVSNNSPLNKNAGGAYAYRASKAAVNTMVRSLAVDVPDVTFVLCHPGRVETNLVKCKEEGAITAQESVAGILPLIAAWNQQDSERFYDRFGETIEW